VTEAEWDACTDPLKLLDFLHGRTSKERMLAFLQGRASDRKARLFALAVCRLARLMPSLKDRRLLLGLAFGKKCREVGADG
jgi:hypothetical protein